MPFRNIDDRSYDSLLAEVRTRIARYTPEWTPVWTDVNDNDPGITMVQVFAWLAEMLDLPHEQGAGAELHQVPATPRHRTERRRNRRRRK